MHASFNDLVRLRDRPQAVDAELASHLRSCAECAQELRLLQDRTEALRRLRSPGAAPDRWDAIQRTLEQPSDVSAPPPRSRPGWWLAAASAAAVAIAVVMTFDARKLPESLEVASTSPVAAGAGAQPGNEAGLIQESQRLEHLLSAFPEQPRITRASTAFTVADLEDRIQWVDYRLNMANAAGLDPDQSRLLWRERVDLLNSLVAVRYAESRTLAF